MYRLPRYSERAGIGEDVRAAILVLYGSCVRAGDLSVAPALLSAGVFNEDGALEIERPTVAVEGSINGMLTKTAVD